MYKNPETGVFNTLMQAKRVNGEIHSITVAIFPQEIELGILNATVGRIINETGMPVHPRELKIGGNYKKLDENGRVVLCRLGIGDGFFKGGIYELG